MWKSHGDNKDTAAVSSTDESLVGMLHNVSGAATSVLKELTAC